MLDAGIIFRVSTSYLVSPIALNKNEKSLFLLILVDFRELNKVTKKDPIPSPFQDVILEEGMTWTAHMIGYSRIDVHIAEEDKLPPLSRRLGFTPTIGCRFYYVMHPSYNHYL